MDHFTLSRRPLIINLGGGELVFLEYPFSPFFILPAHSSGFFFFLIDKPDGLHTPHCAVARSSLSSSPNMKMADPKQSLLA